LAGHGTGTGITEYDYRICYEIDNTDYCCLGRYPGLHCDVEAYIYMPLLEETGYMPSQKYASSVEIRSYLVDIVRQFGLQDNILYRTQVDGLQWDDATHTWKADMTSSRGAGGLEKTTLWANAEFVFISTGLFPRPHVPKLAGLVGFEGNMFHTARWDYDITGGSSETAFPIMDRLKGKRVGIIGTGATAIQVVPEVAKYAQELFVFQRTPSQVNPRGQQDTGATEFRKKVATGPGWQKTRMDNFAQVVASTAPEEYENLVNDEWTRLGAYCAIVGGPSFGTVTPEKAPEHIGHLMALDAKHSAGVRARVSEVVKDKDTAEKLTPWYPVWCKRPTYSDIFLQTFNQDNVRLVDTDGQGVDSVTPQGVVVKGKEYPLDILIFSTGYQSPGVGGGNPAVRTGAEIVGRDGRSLTDKWAAQGPTTLHGCATNGFPNLFWMGPSQTGVTANFAHVLGVLSQHTAYIVAEAHKKAHRNTEGVVIEVSTPAEEEWGMRILQGAAYFSGMAVCTPSYITNEGEALAQTESEAIKSAKGSPWPNGCKYLTRCFLPFLFVL
jgi:cation diffusion facilitator CzcD-associated flavoprotein CzcO